jgi:ABA responsive element binding factor
LLLQRQGSLTLPRTLSAKTVDEVWRNLVRDDPVTGVVADGAEPQPHRQATLGEMTLEEFLVKAGVVREIPTAPAPLPPPPMQQPRPVPVAPKAVDSFYGNFPTANDAGAVTLGFPPVAMGDLTLGNGLMPRAVGMGCGGALLVQTAVNPADSGSKGWPKKDELEGARWRTLEGEAMAAVFCDSGSRTTVERCRPGRRRSDACPAGE